VRNVARLAVALGCAIVGSQIYPAGAETRVALVIGNAKYEHIAALPNVAGDARAMEALLTAAKFDSVVALHDQRVEAMRRELLAFAERATQADVAVLFYAGHGIEVDRVNYLIPVDARLKSDLAVKTETVSLDLVLELMEPARKLRVVILDACRENPFVKSMRITLPTRSVARGLGRIEAGGANTLIAFATEPNAVAEDGAGRNSPFTAALLKHLATPGLDLRLALGHVRDEVMAATGRKQRPYVTSSLGGGVIAIVPKGSDPAGLTPGTPLSPSAPPSAAAQAWASAKDSTSIPLLEAFRRQYGATDGFYDRLAQERIEELRGKQVALQKAEAARKKAEEDAKRDPALGVKPGSGASFRDRTKDGKACAECPEMVVVPSGSFTMGSPPGEESRDADEGPQRRVTIGRPFAVGRFEVTRGEFATFVRETGWSVGDKCWTRDGGTWAERSGRSFRNPGFQQDDRHPVVCVNWDDATAYAGWLSKKTGKTYRLLTEAEWEYATRAGTSTPFWWGSSISPSQANYDGNYTYGGGPKGEYRAKTLAVDSFAPNPWGLYNVHGNVWEWVQDCWNGSYNGAPMDGSAWTTGECGRRVLRGGSWYYGPGALRAADRGGDSSVSRGDNSGFRVGRMLSP
jgi:formylglycine-generating enzyme required for sulfatase activity